MARQIAKLADVNIPYHGRHAHFMNGGWPGGQEPLSARLVSMSSNPLLSGSLKFSGSLPFLGSFVKFSKSASSAFCDCCLGTDCESVIG